MSNQSKLGSIILGFGILYLGKNLTAQEWLGLGFAWLMVIVIVGLFLPPKTK